MSNKLNGSGLGLALVASVVSEHGGAIEVSSSEGETRFKINLPIETADKSEKSSSRLEERL